jgi:hypothetical protein
LPVVGTDKSVETSPGVSDISKAVPTGRHRPADDPLGVPRASRSAPHVVAAVLIGRFLHVVSTTARHSDVRPSARSEDRPAASTGFATPSGFRPRSLHRPGRVGSPLLRFCTPSATSTAEIRLTRAFHARHLPPSGFLTPSTVCSLRGLADTLGPLPLTGFRLEETFRSDRPRRVSASAASFRPRCSSALNSEEYKVASSAGSKTLEPGRPGSMAMVPGLSSPPSKHIISGPSRRLSPPLSPHALEPSAAGRTMPRRAGAPGSSTDPETGEPV